MNYEWKYPMPYKFGKDLPDTEISAADRAKKNRKFERLIELLRGVDLTVKEMERLGYTTSDIQRARKHGYNIVFENKKYKLI